MKFPTPKSTETRLAFMRRAMDDPDLNAQFPGPQDRVAVCQSQWDTRIKFSTPVYNGHCQTCGSCDVHMNKGTTVTCRACGSDAQSPIPVAGSGE